MRPSVAWALIQIVLLLANYVGTPLPKLDGVGPVDNRPFTD